MSVKINHQRIILLILITLSLIILWWEAIRNGLGGDFFYDEAVYANLSEHPFISDYYYDPVFCRHPPFIYLFQWALLKILDGVKVEILFRISALIFSSIGLVLLWLNLKYLTNSIIISIASIAAIVTSGLFVRYSISATMYPYLFFFLQLAFIGIIKNNKVLRNTAFILLMYTHYMGVVVFVLYIISLWIKGYGKKEIFKENKVVIFSYIPIIWIAIVGFTYHTTRLTHHRFFYNYLAMLYYFPLSVWAGTLYIFSKSTRVNLMQDKDILIILIFAFVLLYLLLCPVIRPFERYAYSVFPIFLLCGSYGIRELTSDIKTKHLKILLTVLLIFLYFLPYRLLSHYESMWFDGFYADNNKYQNWCSVVKLCSQKYEGKTILTNNTRSFAFYLTKENSKRYILQRLDKKGKGFRYFSYIGNNVTRSKFTKKGELFQFDSNLKDFIQYFKKMDSCLVIMNNYPYLRRISDYLDKMRSCRCTLKSENILIYQCNMN
ncbi:MAG: hypothetical protein AMJ45_01195 [Syntrophobacter sp. DG_60]|nr:MAG: hypothetical protein AMJ45_01195 [Syntrophobacter sp. DG_60]